MFTRETLIHAGQTFLMLFGELFGLFIGISFVVALLQMGRVLKSGDVVKLFQKLGF